MQKYYHSMFSLRVWMVAAISFIASVTFATSTARDYSRLVNTLIGSGTTYGLASGYICPGATYSIAVAVATTLVIFPCSP